MNQSDIPNFLKEAPSVPNTSIQPDVPVSQILQQDFLTTSKNFWSTARSGEFGSMYIGGEVAATYNKLPPSLETLSLMYLNSIKAVVRSNEDLDSADLVELEMYYKNLELAQNLLAQKLHKISNKSIDGFSLMAYIHGMINKFINVNIKEKHG